MNKFVRFFLNFLVNAVVLACVIFISLGNGFSQTRQEHIHHQAHTVMPFDISRAVHFFKMTESGGTQRVVAKDPGDVHQVRLIREHLRHEAEKFQQGDYSAPAQLHGADMPGLKELQAGAERMSISYTEIPAGAAISFETDDISLITAVHRWFGAQLSEHGADARAE